MLFGVTLRSPHASARIHSIATEIARAAPGVRAVLTADDVPGEPTFGLEVADQPVLASDVVRYAGEPVALVAAESLEQARAAAELIEVDYEPVPVVTDMEEALRPEAPDVHEGGNVLRHVHIEHGDLDAVEPDVWVEGYYETPMQDQAALGPGGRTRHAIRRRRRRAPRDLAVHPQRPPAGGGVPRPAGGARAGRDRRRRRRVRVARGRARADPRLPARPADEPPGQDRLRPRGVVPRPRAPAPVADLDPVRGDERRPPRRGRRPVAPRRRRLYVLLAPCSPTRRPSPPGHTRCRTSASRAPPSSPTTRPAARCAGSARPRSASRTSRRWTRWPRSSASNRSSCACRTSCTPAPSFPPAKC